MNLRKILLSIYMIFFKTESSKNGSAIIIVLIIFVIAGILSTFMLGLARRNIMFSKLLEDKAYANIGADSTIEKVKFFFSTGEYKSFYVKNNLDGFPNIVYFDGRIQKLEKDNVSIEIQGSGGLISVWGIDYAALKNLLIEEGINEIKVKKIISSIKDWYDKDSLPSFDGAEYPYYKFKGCRYVPRNSYGIQSIYELKDINGLDNKTFSLIEKFLILSPNWRYNINVMNSEMLSVVFGFSKDIAESLIKEKENGNCLKISDIKKYTQISNFDNLKYSSFSTLVVRVKVVYNFKEATEKKVCVIDFRLTPEKPFRVLKWED